MREMSRTTRDLLIAHLSGPQHPPEGGGAKLKRAARRMAVVKGLLVGDLDHLDRATAITERGRRALRRALRDWTSAAERALQGRLSGADGEEAWTTQFRAPTSEGTFSPEVLAAASAD